MKRFRIFTLILMIGSLASVAATTQNKKGFVTNWTVSGAVRRPGHANSRTETPVMVTRAIAGAGGPTSQADETSVRISHKNREDVHVDYGAIMRQERPDVPIDDGDEIYVPFKR